MKPDYGQISDTHILTQKALITKEMKPYSVCYAFIIKPFCCVFHECLFMMCNLYVSVTAGSIPRCNWKFPEFGLS